MDNKTKLLAASVLSTAVLFNSATTFAASFSAIATADIVAPISILEVKAVDFGAIVPPTTSTCSVSVEESGAISQTTDCGLLGGHSNGEYSITGDGAYDMTISVAATSTFTGGLTFVVGSSTIGATAPWASPLTFLVAGTLFVPVGTPPGPISGTYDVTADYV